MDDAAKAEIRAAVEAALKAHLGELRLISPEDHELQHEWISMKLAREAKVSKLMDAVIEKTLTALLWAMIVWVCLIFLDGLRAQFPGVFKK
jgi:hypothetical protein